MTKWIVFAALVIANVVFFGYAGKWGLLSTVYILVALGITATVAVALDRHDRPGS